MSAETLRKAAALMRERANDADRDSFTRGPWTARVFDDGRAWFGPARHSMHGYPNTAVHCASWHPAVARAVADWLSSEAAHYERSYPKGHIDGELDTASRHALAVARAYLGDDA